MDVAPEPGLADSGDLEFDLTALLEAVAMAAKRSETALLLIVDEMQYTREKELGALLTAVHKAAQRGWPVTLTGAGLPQLRSQLGRARSCAERLFEFTELGRPSREAAKDAVQRPLRRRGVGIRPEALQLIVDRTEGYPYFLQEWGSTPGTRPCARPSTRRTFAKPKCTWQRRSTQASSGSATTG